MAQWHISNNNKFVARRKEKGKDEKGNDIEVIKYYIRVESEEFENVFTKPKEITKSDLLSLHGIDMEALEYASDNAKPFVKKIIIPENKFNIEDVL